MSGELLTKTVLLLLLVLVSAPTVTLWLQGHTEHIVRQVIYFSTSLLLLFYVWRGNIWAWRLTVSLSMLAGLLTLLVGMLVHWAFAIVGGLFLFCGVLLVGHPQVREFLRQQQEGMVKPS